MNEKSVSERQAENLRPESDDVLNWKGKKAGPTRWMTQEEVAERMKTSRSFVARLEGGSVTPTWKSLQRYAHATGTKLRIELEHA